MLRSSITTRGKGRGIGAALALALAGCAAGAIAFASPALAQVQPELSPSRGFNRVFQPVAAIANAAAGDFAAAKAQVPALLAAVENADDRYLAGNVIYVLGVKLTERPLQQQGMEMMLQSGKATALAAAEMNYFLGEWAYDDQQWAKVRQYMQAARAGGYTQGNAEGLTAESYFRERQLEPGLAYLEGMIQQRVSAGQPAPEPWLRRGQQAAFDASNVDLTTKWSTLLLDHNPSPENWTRTLQMVGALQPLERQAQLDLLRLMAATNSLTGRALFERYIQAADPRLMATEVRRVLEAGVQAGVFDTGEEFYTLTRSTVDERASGEPADAAAYAADARGATSGRDAASAGDLYLGLQSYAEAETMFSLALEQGDIDRDAALTRLGIAQIQLGKIDQARASLQQVTGPRAVVARLWSAYAGSKT